MLRVSTICLEPVRHIRHKPWIPKFRLIRQMQPWVRPFDPDLLFLGGKTGPERTTASEIREQLKRNGLMPPLIFQDRPINITHSGRIFDEYVPPEGDGKASILSAEGLSEKKDLLSKKAKSMRAMRRISKHQPTFNTAAFPSEADAIYKEANILLPKYFDNESRLLELLTEKAFVEMTDGLRLRTLEWQFKGSLEPPRVVSMRTEEAIGKDNIFAQVTVRFLTQQVLAIYDRFGRLLFGHPTSAVDVLEYIVFENHITDAFGQWRIHGKIVPPWARVMTAPNRTHKLLPASNKMTADSEGQLNTTEPHLGDDEAVICPTIGIAHRLGYQHVLSISPPDENIVQQTTAPRPRVHPSGLLPRRKAEEGVGQQEMVFRTRAQKKEAVTMHTYVAKDATGKT
ncbi:unnamed protein product [Schistocephalus solidus]|uniref:Large ribosomal subunit protein mL45 n=1 Tax=Schistocephalus solidus TaxID=70667 RepID=A0A3P7CZ71_SCHSO|nr:unnamed protein product [Schistocephalus solidus]